MFYEFQRVIALELCDSPLFDFCEFPGEKHEKKNEKREGDNKWKSYHRS